MGGGKFHSGIRINATEGLTHSMMGMADKTAKSIIEMPLLNMHAGGTFPVAAVSLILADFRLGVKSCTLVIDLLAFAAKYVHTKSGSREMPL